MEHQDCPYISNHCYFLLAALAQGFQFHSQTLVGPQLSAWCELTGSEGLRETGERYYLVG